MPTPKPRPSQKPRSQAAPRNTSRKSDSRTLDLSAPSRPSTSRPATAPSRTASRATLDPNDAGVKRRARKKVERRKKNALVWGTTLCLSAIICGMSAGVYNRYDAMKGKVSDKNDMLHTLQKQLAEKTARLATLNSSVGKERALVERGFVRDGERLLLFPKKKSAN